MSDYVENGTQEKASAGGDAKRGRILGQFRHTYTKKAKWMKEAREDFEFTMGKQWEDDVVTALIAKRVRPLTINRIRPNIQLLVGLESQNRTDFVAYPEGAEDSLVADVCTRLLKNAMKCAGGDYKVSEQFEDGLICGESFTEPYLDFTYNLINGQLKIKKHHYAVILVDPDSTEYDLSDAKFVFKLIQDLTEDEILAFFPDEAAQAKIKKLKLKKVLDENNEVLEGLESITDDIQRPGYADAEPGAAGDGKPKEPRYDLLEYYYQKWTDVFYVADAKKGIWKEFKDKGSADAYVNTATEGEPKDQKTAQVIKRRIPEIWVCRFVGNEEIENTPSWTWPRWKGYPFIPYFAWRSTTPLKDHPELQVQGITRGLKDLNRDYNKRRTNELQHLNQSTNSGWLAEENAWVNETKVDEMGSSPGVTLYYRQGKKPERIQPTPLSQGHAQMAAERLQEMKEAAGINTDLLAMAEGGQDSGRAISLRQKQGLVMVQKFFDNLSQTKRLLGRFILAHLGDIYDVESAVRVCGEAFITENFSEPVMAPMMGPNGPMMDPATGQPAQQPVVDPMTQQPVTRINEQAVKETFNRVLNDAMLGKYDVAVGEGASNETALYAQYLQVMEMAEKGLPIPPDVIVDASSLPAATKEKIKQALVAAAQNPAPAKPEKNAA